MRWRFRGGILQVQMEREREGEESVCRLEVGEEEEEQCLPLLGPSEVLVSSGSAILPQESLKCLSLPAYMYHIFEIRVM